MRIMKTDPWYTLHWQQWSFCFSTLQIDIDFDEAGFFFIDTDIL